MISTLQYSKQEIYEMQKEETLKGIENAYLYRSAEIITKEEYLMDNGNGSNVTVIFSQIEFSDSDYYVFVVQILRKSKELRKYGIYHSDAIKILESINLK